MPLKLTYLLAAALVLLPGAAARAAPDAAAPPRPNIVVIETDDQTLEEMRFLPKTQQLLAREGVTFDNFFVSFSLCCPSRASFLTGQYSHNNGVRSNQAPTGGYYSLDSSRTLAVWLRRAGYYTAEIGKYLNQYGTRDATEIPAGWSEWHASVDPSTYRYYNYTLNEQGRLTTYCATPDPACYSTDLYRDKAVELITRRARAAQPFFLWFTPLAPHAGQPRDDDDPRTLGTPSPAPRHIDLYADVPLPTPPSFNEADVSDKPSDIQRRPLLSSADIAAIRENYQQRAESLAAVDEAVAAIVAALRTSGELDQTLIFFTSDNGFFHGEHRVKTGKVLVYEPSVHVPLIVRGPGIPKNAHLQQLAMNVDLAPTILEAARATAIGRAVDGASLWQLIRDPQKELGRDILLESPPNAAHFEAIRTRNYKYVEYTSTERELYDLVRDPYELQNVAGTSEYAPVEAALATRLARLKLCRAAACRERPNARLVLHYARGPGGCAEGPITAEVPGTGLLAVAIYTDGRRRGADGRAPFSLAFTGRRGRTILVRARVSALGDRVVTLDVKLRTCR